MISPFKALIFKRWIMRTVAVPKSQLKAQAARATVPVIVTIETGERESWESTLSPHDAKHWALVIPNDLLKARGLTVDDEVMLSVVYDAERKPPAIPEDIARSLQSRPGAMTNFRAMALSWQRQMLRYVDKGKSPDTREKYIEIMIERVNEAQLKRDAKPASNPSSAAIKKVTAKKPAAKAQAVKKAGKPASKHNKA
jgi:hypothetical protein